MKKMSLFILLLIGLLSIVTACGQDNAGKSDSQENSNETSGQESSNEGTSDQTHKEESSKEEKQEKKSNGKLVMATSADYPPFEFYDLKNGEGVVGFDVDIAKYIANELGYELEIQDQSFDGLIPALQAKRIDFVIAGMQATEERKKSVDFSETYYQGDQAIVFKKGAGISGPSDIDGKKVGVQLGTTSEEAAKDIEGIELVQLNKLNDVVMELKNGRIGAAVFSETVAKAYLATHKDLDYVPLNTGKEAGNAIAFPKGSPLVDDFNEVLKEMKENGELDKLIKKWFE